MDQAKPSSNATEQPGGPWWQGVTLYQWWVLLLASLGWVFDVFEGQLFVASMNESMPALLPPDTPRGTVAFYTNITFAAFLLGGALGGVVFGVLADRFGRARMMGYTILMYSAFTCLSAFSEAWWQLAIFRFLVALGVGGEWAVASALVAEVFPARARPWSQSIFHASSVLGTFLAIAVGRLLLARAHLSYTVSLAGHSWELSGWRLAFLVGAVPALLIVAVRLGLREPERWVRATGERARFWELLAGPLARRTTVGVALATVGLATFWGTHIYGKDALRLAYLREAVDVPTPAEVKAEEMLGMFLTTLGGGLGLVCFGPLSERLGRRGAFLLYQLGGLAATLVLFGLLSSTFAIRLFLPAFGFLTLGMHAGYAVYFPELFPTRLRGAGGGFCFNVGRLFAAPIVFLGGWMQQDWGFSLAQTCSLLGLLFLPGALLLLAAPETRGRDLEA